MACLKLMGGYCFLKTKKGKKSLMESVKLTMDEVDHVDEVQINGVHFDYEYFGSILHLDDFAFNVERCKKVLEFLVLTKIHFEQEQYIKKRLYGKEFENMDCHDVVKNYLHGVTLLHTFNDDFTFVDFNSMCIPCSWMHSEKRHSLSKVVSPCEMAKMHLVMMSFVHNQIEHVSPFNQLGDFDIHEHIGSRVFFHDRLLERWMCDINLDVVSESFSKKSSNAKECKDFVKRNIFITFDKITWELENGEERLMVYIHDGDYLTSGLCKALIKLSERFEGSCYFINNRGSRENCQHHSLRVIRVSRHFSIIDALHNPKLRFNYVSTVSGIVLNRQIERKALKKN